MQNAGKPKHGTVRVTIPVAVAGNLNQLNQSITELVARLGCGACFSGADCRFQLERDLVVRLNNNAVEVSSAPGVASVDPDGEPARAITVGLARDVRNNLDSVKKAVAAVVGKLGCPGCCSGFDITFRDELRFLTVNKELNVNEHAI